MINNFISKLEENNEIEALQLLQNNPNLLFEKSEDGWNILQLACYYNNADIVSYFLNNSDYELINTAKVHPLLIAIEEKNEQVINSFLNFSDQAKINWNIKDKIGNNLSYLSIFYGLTKFVKQFSDKKISIFENNNQGFNAFSLIIDKNDLILFEELYQNKDMKNNFNELFIKKSLQKDSVLIFNELEQYSKIEPDELFTIAAGFNSIKIISQIIENGDFIPGMEQITTIVDLMCRKYTNEDDCLAAIKLADYLFEIKTPFNKFVNNQGQNAWMLCIENNNEEIFSRLINSSEHINAIDKEQHSPLFYAIEKNNNKFVKLLLKNKPNLQQFDKQKNSPLIKAVEKGNLEMVRDILCHFQLINHTNLQNEHALSLAIKNRKMDIVSELIWAGGEITTNPVKIVEEKHMFHLGSSGEPERFAYHDEEHIDNFVALSKLGFKLNQLNNNGETLLIHFIKNGYLSNFSALMRCQFNPNQIDNDGNNALMCSVLKNNNVYFNSLINKFKNIDFKQVNNNGKNIYDLCLDTEKVQLIEKLIIYDDNICIKDSITASKLIAKKGDLETYVNQLTKSGLNLNFTDENNNTLLMFSLIGGNLKNFKYLIENNLIDIDIKNNKGHSVSDIIHSMPVDIGYKFSSVLNIHLKKKINKC